MKVVIVVVWHKDMIDFVLKYQMKLICLLVWVKFFISWNVSQK